MARLRSPVVAGAWISQALRDPMPDPAAVRRNGRYRGKLPVRELARGVSGAELSSRRRAPAARQLWQRGDQLVRVLRLDGRWIVFRELSHGQCVRRMRLSHFLRTSHPKEQP